MTIRELQRAAWEGAESKGFHDGRSASRDDTLVRLCLIHSEVSEAVQAVKRHWTGDGGLPALEMLAEELADVMIRCADLAGCCGIDLCAATVEKLAKNAKRPHRYGTPAEGVGL